ncbi:PE-PPE domain-containing protein [Mycolicibacterium neoaurum]|uniref:PE-PPE domain-containing protein n=1 Tax=Mycolicibacterium neoaurum TaxID=1795 RepID=UPI001F2498FB|nr:PE-PPE domain-containing protein [Mycolicibacterium neoaurum]
MASIRSHVDIDCGNGDVTATHWGDPGISRFDIYMPQAKGRQATVALESRFILGRELHMRVTRRLRQTASIAMSVAFGMCLLSPISAHAEPAGATVLTLAPAFFPLPGNWLRGELFAAPNTTVKVPYNNFPAAANVHKGADLLDDLLHSTAGPKIVLGHSEGAQVQDDWLRRYGPTSDIDPATVQFILTGDPEHRFNGCTRVPAPTPTEPDKKVCKFIYHSYDAPGGFTGPGFPDDTRYNVTVISRQYDYWSDCPNPLISGSPADKNRDAANSVGGKGELKAVHLDYGMIGLNDPNNQVYVDRNVKYVLGSPATYYLPMVTQKWISQAQKQAQDLELRPQVELNYGRPMGSPTPPSS